MRVPVLGRKCDFAEPWPQSFAQSCPRARGSSRLLYHIVVLTKPVRIPCSSTSDRRPIVAPEASERVAFGRWPPATAFSESSRPQ